MSSQSVHPAIKGTERLPRSRHCARLYMSLLPSTSDCKASEEGTPGLGPARRRLSPRPPPHQAQLLAATVTAKQLEVSVSRPVTLQVLSAAFILCVPSTAGHGQPPVPPLLSTDALAPRSGPLPSLPCADPPPLPCPRGTCLLSSPLHYLPMLDCLFVDQGHLLPAPLPC